jgi:transposase, IS5 family
MRAERTRQASLFDVFARHDIGRELQAISVWLDEHPALLRLVAVDLRQPAATRATGRCGLPAEAVLRCAVLKQYRQLSYEELAFHLEDSASFRAFARLPLAWSPKKSVLHMTISAISAATWEAINQVVVGSARRQKLESGAMVRIDSTVTRALMHAPSDSSLLWDAVRVMVRLLGKAGGLPDAPPIVWRNHRRLAKKRALAIQYSRGKPQRAKLYRELIAATRATLCALQGAAARIAACGSLEAELWRGQVEHYRPLIERLIDQAERRVLAGESVPAAEKLVSLFETHADIIVKGGREVHYGHKLNLTSGRSGMILDVVVEAGNPADAERFLPMLERCIAQQGEAPRQTASDGGYASAANLRGAKALGVRDAAFHKKCGLSVVDMVKSHWVYRKLKNFRAGIEANISTLKRTFGLDRCTWRGLSHFKAYVWSSVVAYNLTLLTRLVAT